MRLYFFSILNRRSILLIRTRESSISPRLLVEIVFVKFSIWLTFNCWLRYWNWLLFLLNWLFSNDSCLWIWFRCCSFLSFFNLLRANKTENIWFLDEIFRPTSFDLAWQNLECFEIEPSWRSYFEFFSLTLILIVEIMSTHCSIHFLLLWLTLRFLSRFLFRCSSSSFLLCIFRHIKSLNLVFFFD